MDAKEKAQELVGKYLSQEYVLWSHDGEPFTYPQGKITMGTSKECAKICVKEIIQASPNDFWIEVLREIDNL